MATKQIKKIATAANDVSGLKSSRYEKLQVSYGVIPANTVGIDDVLSFSDVPSQDIIRATITILEDEPKQLNILPGTATSLQLTLATAQASSDPGDLVESKISYVIEYVRGTGKVGVSASTPSALLDNTDTDGPSGPNVASGDCLQVKIVAA